MCWSIYMILCSSSYYSIAWHSSERKELYDVIPPGLSIADESANFYCYQVVRQWYDFFNQLTLKSYFICAVLSEDAHLFATVGPKVSKCLQQHLRSKRMNYPTFIIKCTAGCLNLFPQSSNCWLGGIRRRNECYWRSHSIMSSCYEE